MPGSFILVLSLASSLSAQLLKLFINLILRRKFDLKIIFSTGGMPSSHSALVSCLAACIGLTEGINSINFAISVIFAVIVMHDAASVRRSVGIQARNLNMLNQFIKDLFKEVREINSETIKELLGHTPIEVTAGCIWGIIISFSGFWGWQICAANSSLN